MSISVDEVSPATIEDDGGAELVITGEFTVGVPLAVHIGAAGDATDEQALSGNPGAMFEIIATSPTRIKVFAPVLAAGATYKIFVTDGDDDDVLLAALTVVKRNYKSNVFNYKRALPPHWKLGARSTEGLEPV